jgi:hypothetical protein
MGVKRNFYGDKHVVNCHKQLKELKKKSYTSALSVLAIRVCMSKGRI